MQMIFRFINPWHIKTAGLFFSTQMLYTVMISNDLFALYFICETFLWKNLVMGE